MPPNRQDDIIYRDPRENLPRGFSTLSSADRVDWSAQYERVTNEISYYIECDAVFLALDNLFMHCRRLWQAGIPVPLWWYTNPTDRSITTLPGIIVDYASVPRPAWVVLAPKDITRPAIHHDAGYRLLWYLRNHGKIPVYKFSYYRKVFDFLFRESMQYLEPDIASYKKFAAYHAVRIFGGIKFLTGRPLPQQILEQPLPDWNYISLPRG